jgi:hypothetical protein
MTTKYYFLREHNNLLHIFNATREENTKIYPIDKPLCKTENITLETTTIYKTVLDSSDLWTEIDSLKEKVCSQCMDKFKLKISPN